MPRVAPDAECSARIRSGLRLVLEVEGRPWAEAVRWVEATRAAVAIVDVGADPPKPPSRRTLRFAGDRPSLADVPVAADVGVTEFPWGRSPDLIWHRPGGEGGTPPVDQHAADAGAAAWGLDLDVEDAEAWERLAATAQVPWAVVRVTVGGPGDGAALRRARAFAPVLVARLRPAVGGGLPESVDAALATLRTREAAWSAGLGGRLRAGGVPGSALFRWSEAFGRWFDEGIDADAWRTRRYEEMAPMLGRTAGALLRALEGEARAAFAEFWEAYGKALDRLDRAVEAALADAGRIERSPQADGVDPDAVAAVLREADAVSCGRGGFAEVRACIEAALRSTR